MLPSYPDYTGILAFNPVLDGEVAAFAQVLTHDKNSENMPSPNPSWSFSGGMLVSVTPPSYLVLLTARPRLLF